jgi:hypothetical protein
MFLYCRLARADPPSLPRIDESLSILDVTVTFVREKVTNAYQIETLLEGHDSKTDSARKGLRSLSLPFVCAFLPQWQTPPMVLSDTHRT